jgi:anti-sigma regulatory factor (Ser/Thr protein kinase)
MGCWHQSQTFDLPATEAGVGLARNCARSVLQRHDPEVVEVIELLVSELVTNALTHASSVSTLRIDSRTDAVRVSVDDQSTVGPWVRHPSPDDDGGRGLLLVDALAASWGWEPLASGKRVWFIV